MKILIDSNIVINSITHRSFEEPVAITFGNRKFIVPILQRKRCSPRNDEIFRLRNLPYLASLCFQADKGKFQFFTSFELSMEKFRHEPHPKQGNAYNEGYFGINFLSNITLNETISPIERTIVIGAENIGTTEDEQMDFFKSIKDSRFIELRKEFNKDSCIDDIFHFWTAEFNNLDIFLTMDKIFYKAYVRNKDKITSRVRVMTPEDLCIEISIPPTDIEEYGKRHIP